MILSIELRACLHPKYLLFKKTFQQVTMFTWLFGLGIYHCQSSINPPACSLHSPIGEDHTDPRAHLSRWCQCRPSHGLMRKPASKPRTQGTKRKDSRLGLSKSRERGRRREQRQKTRGKEEKGLCVSLALASP